MDPSTFLTLELTCPVCLILPLKGSLLQCRKGHLVCEECWRQFKFPQRVCPECRGSYIIEEGGLPQKNLLATRLLDSILFSCKQEDQCQEKLTRSEMAKHEVICGSELVKNLRGQLEKMEEKVSKQDETITELKSKTDEMERETEEVRWEKDELKERLQEERTEQVLLRVEISVLKRDKAELERSLQRLKTDQLAPAVAKAKIREEGEERSDVGQAGLQPSNTAQPPTSSAEASPARFQGVAKDGGLICRCGQCGNNFHIRLRAKTGEK